MSTVRLGRVGHENERPTQLALVSSQGNGYFCPRLIGKVRMFGRDDPWMNDLASTLTFRQGK